MKKEVEYSNNKQWQV